MKTVTDTDYAHAVVARASGESIEGLEQLLLLTGRADEFATDVETIRQRLWQQQVTDDLRAIRGLLERSCEALEALRGSLTGPPTPPTP